MKMGIRENRIKEFLLPERIVKAEGNIHNLERLLTGFEKQNFFKIDKPCTIKGKGYIILDFGREIYGTLRLMINKFFDEKPGNNFRIRFGESVTETCAEIGEKGATNDHSTRDMEIYMSPNSDMEWGNTGFRFVRIDFLLNQTYIVNKIVAGFIHSDMERIGNFRTSNRLSEIYDTATYTLFLNVQNSIWDGIKRDQHLWVGDLYPELTGLLLSYGNIPVIEESLEGIVSHYKMPAWYNEIPAYNIWFVLCVNDFIKYTGIENQKIIAEVEKNIDQFDNCIDAYGEVDFHRIGASMWVDDFFEWPCFETPSGRIGVFYLLKYTLQKVVEEKFFNEKITEKARKALARIKDAKQPITNVKSVESLRVLCGENIEESVTILLEGGAKGCSVFFMYFILKALADNGKGVEALQIAQDYYGAMLDKGATTFWENFDIEWVNGSSRIDAFPQENEKDIHGDFGAHCYTGFRHSLCHGWSSGIVAFLIENVVGIKVKEKGFKKIEIQPMENIDCIKCDVPTPYGMISMETVASVGDKKQVHLRKPKEIEII